MKNNIAQRRPSRDIPDLSHGPRSLWEMVANFHYSSVGRVLEEVRILITTSRRNMTIQGQLPPGDLEDEPKHQEAIRQAIQAIEYCSEHGPKLFADLKSQHVDGAFRRLQHIPRDPFVWSELNTRARALRDAIETELQGLYFYRYPKQKSEKLAAWKDEWRKSLAAFPQITRDVFCALDCYALQHDTASVFHSMRVAEYGLRALGKERKVKLAKNKPLEWGTWQEIIKALDDEIKIIGGKKPGLAKDSALEFYSGARADLNGFKDEYRNLVMHVRADYDEHQAIRAISNVHAFMERISAKIDFSHHRIRWGLR